MRFDPLNSTLDFNGDNRADIYWRNDAADVNAIWMMNGGQISRASALPNVSEELGWRDTSFGDFDGNGKTDFFWRNTSTGQNVLWLMDGGTIAAGFALPTVTTDWTYKLADFNGDGTSDLFWHNQSNGAAVVWQFSQGGISKGEFLGYVPPEWEAYVADFNADRKTDLFWRNENTGDNVVWTFNGTTVTGAAYIGNKTLDWQPTVVDLDADGRTDIFWHNPQGFNQVTFWSQTSIYAANTIDLPKTTIDIGRRSADAQFEIIDLGNQNGIFTYDPLTNQASFWVFPNRTLVSNQTTIDSGLYGLNFDLADFDGDGQSDIFGADRFTGEIAIGTSSSNYQQIREFQVTSNNTWLYVV
jgi:FG-GAP-like repeat